MNAIDETPLNIMTADEVFGPFRQLALSNPTAIPMLDILAAGYGREMEQYWFAYYRPQSRHTMMIEVAR